MSNMIYAAAAVSALAAFIYTAMLAVQQMGNIKSMERTEKSALVRLLKTPLWYVGLFGGIFGFALHFGALMMVTGGLVVVQAAQVSEIAFMLPFSGWTSKMKVEPHEYIGAAVVMVGLVGYIIMVAPWPDGRGIERPSGAAWAWLIGIALVAIALLMLAGRLIQPLRAALYGAAAGVLFGLQGATMDSTGAVLEAKGLIATFEGWEPYGVVVFGLSAVAFSQFALRAGKLSTALATLTVLLPISSTIIGLTIFEQKLPYPTPLGFFLFGLAAMIVFAGVVMLARSPAIMASEAAEADAPVEADIAET